MCRCGFIYEHVLDYYLHIRDYGKLRAGYEADQYALNMLTVDGGRDPDPNLI